MTTNGIPSIDKNSIDKINIDNIYGQNEFGQEKIEEQINSWEEQFEEFYKQYPKKVKKQEVKKWFEKNKPSNELFSSMMNSLEQFRGSKDWLKDNGQYIPYPSTWLKQKRWEDEKTDIQKSSSHGFKQRKYDNLDFLYINTRIGGANDEEKR